LILGAGHMPFEAGSFSLEGLLLAVEEIGSV
jgi:hypothetical protein